MKRSPLPKSIDMVCEHCRSGYALTGPERRKESLKRRFCSVKCKYDSRRIELTGQRFGRLVVVESAGKLYGLPAWHVRCDCGGSSVVTTGNLTKPNTRSCGCLGEETRPFNNRTHGLTETREYTTWMAMRRRCSDTKSPDYPNYGGRGISVCVRWAESFEHFYADMGPRPSAKHSIDRINNDGNYEPGNCRWATRSQQNANRRPFKQPRRAKRLEPARTLPDTEDTSQPSRVAS